ncbi:MAG: hypothetical protein EZS28_022484 [Streblomastix strix]|uniref:ubiquitinyl hydrolase 1 n=1 Tax=Streblomastix strix TaxID=222440 RepID=A0A5J4VHE4_9EUKA|nr:MAG: hypothetical protein EZS28_022484 [Streblomastix strix]
MQTDISFRLRTGDGHHPLVVITNQKTYTVRANDTLRTVQEIIAKDVGSTPEAVQLLYGYPPKKITGGPDTLIKNIIHNSDSLVLELIPPPLPPASIISQSCHYEKKDEQTNAGV